MKYLLPLLLLANTAHAADWVHISTGLGDGGKFYIDKDSIQTHRFSGGGNYKTAWRKIEYPSTQKLTYSPYKSYNESKDFEYYDCTAKKVVLESVHTYLNGQPVDSGNQFVPTSSSATWDRVIPDSVGEHMLNFVCRH